MIGSTAYYTATCGGCGRIVAACVDAPEYRKDTAKDMARWVRDGLAIERVVTMFGVTMGGCRCETNPRTGKRYTPSQISLTEPDSGAGAATTFENSACVSESSGSAETTRND